jgi:acyl-coenzyme A synthetase/AMP-(fatty) acid ligase
MSALVAASAQRFGSAPALELPEKDERFTLAQLASRVAGIVATLRELGADTGDRILLALDNRALMPMMTFAASDLGAATFAVNPGSTPTELEYVLDKMTPRFVPRCRVLRDARSAAHWRRNRAVGRSAAAVSRLFAPQEVHESPAPSIADDIISAFSSVPPASKSVPRKQRQWRSIHWRSGIRTTG